MAGDTGYLINVGNFNLIEPWYIKKAGDLHGKVPSL